MHNTSPPPPADASATLEHAAIGKPGVIARIEAPAEAPEWTQWLEEIGFMPGEQVCVIARGAPGGDPLVVRVGLSTFALRRAEAACVRLAKPQATGP
jgi:ferrous iron transport protein A